MYPVSQILPELAETPNEVSPFGVLIDRTDTRECRKPAPMPVTYWAGTATGSW